MIKFLDQELIKKISAGQFVNDYVSIIKELVENSIDSQPTNIEIYFSTNEIKVVDNGVGMNKHDLAICTLLNTTSKITTLEEVNTLGFRGEALYWINQIADLTIISKQKGSEAYLLHNGIIELTFSNNGTIVICKNIFYNYQSRLQFISLRSQINKIKTLIEKYIICYENIKFRLYINNIITNFKLDFLEKEFLFLYKETNDFKLKGKIFIYEKGHNYFYVNGRPVEDAQLVENISYSYRKITGRNYCPSFVIFLECNPVFVDININSKKTEVLINLEDFYKYTKNLSFTQKRTKETQSEISSWRFLGEIFGNYLLATKENDLFIFDHHACHERIIFEMLDKQDFPKQQLVLPILIKNSETFEFEEDLKKICNFYINNNTIIITSCADFIKLEYLENIKLNPNFLVDFLHNQGCICAPNMGNRITEQQFYTLVENLFKSNNYQFCNHGRPTFIRITKSELNSKFKK